MHYGRRLLIFIVIVSGIVIVTGLAAVLYRGDLSRSESGGNPGSTSSLTQNATSASSSEAGWYKYENTKYDFTFQYPSTFVLDVNPSQDLGGDVSQPFYQDDSNVLSVGPGSQSNGGLPEMLEIYVQDPTASGIQGYDEPAQFWAVPLPTLITKIQGLAEKQESLGPMMTTTVAGVAAYGFTADKGIGFNDFGEALNSEHLWLFVPDGSVVLELIVPDASPYLEILNSLSLSVDH